MGKIYSSLDPRLQEFVQAQHMFFVGTAPLGAEEHVNVSPKGLDSFRVLGPNEVAYLDYVGSGAETIAHLRENGRIVLMFCAFHGPPKIVRLHGRGQVIEPQDFGFKHLAAQFDAGPGVRSVIRIHITRISDSCGYSVPLYRHEKDRTQLGAWAQHKGPAGLIEYQKKLNSASIDGLPALRWVENPDPRYPIGLFDPEA
jgi:hypothetical protein